MNAMDKIHFVCLFLHIAQQASVTGDDQLPALGQSGERIQDQWPILGIHTATKRANPFFTVTFDQAAEAEVACRGRARP